MSNSVMRAEGAVAPAEVSACSACMAQAPTATRWRRGTQAGFFALFLLAPALDVLRFDLLETQLYFLGQKWTLGLDALQRGEIDATTAAWQLVGRAFVPGLLLVLGFLAIAYRWGRLYCGWLCPHFSLVEGINQVLHRASGRYSLWERPEPQPAHPPDPGWWPVFALSCLLAGALWAVTLLTYLLPPARVWGHLLTGTLSASEARFLGVATALIAAELAFARHLFCRYGCAVGLFQSLAWMANLRALVVSFERDRARQCRSCQPRPGNACEVVCPMRLKPRAIKRLMFSCVQCGRCLSACAASHAAQQRPPSLTWTVGVEALRETLRNGPQSATATPQPPPWKTP